MAQQVKNLPAVQETWVQSPGWEDPLENGTTLKMIHIQNKNKIKDWRSLQYTNTVEWARMLAPL